MKLFYHSEGGSFPTILILHGLFGMSDNWVSFAKKWSGSARVIVPDLRNHGRSPHSHIFGYYPMMDDIMELIDDLHLKNIKLLGHSMGGKLAMMLAVEYPDIFEQLCVADISPVDYPPTRHAEILDLMNSVDFDQFQGRGELEKYLMSVLNDSRLAAFIMKNIKLSDKGRLAWKLNLKSISENIADIFTFPVLTGTFDKKVLFLRGEYSDYILQDHQPAIKYYFPEAEIKVIHNAGHWLHVDNQAEFDNLISDFFGI